MSSLPHVSAPNDHAKAPFGASRWAPVAFADPPHLPAFGAADVQPILPGIDLWDCWPLAHEDGRSVIHGGRTWWFYLSAPSLPDPVDRHLVARIRLLSRGDDGWRDHGPALPDGLNPGLREWAGSAVLADDGVGYSLDEYNRGVLTPAIEARLAQAKADIIAGKLSVPVYKE